MEVWCRVGGAYRVGGVTEKMGEIDGVKTLRGVNEWKLTNRDGSRKLQVCRNSCR